MDHFTQLKRQVLRYLLVLLLITSAIMLAGWWIGSSLLQANVTLLLLILSVLAAIVALLFARMATNYVLEPVRMLWQAILHVSPEHADAPAPNLQTAKVGHELINSLVLQVYQLASNSGKPADKAQIDNVAVAIASSLPLPVFVMDRNQVIMYVNDTAAKYVGVPTNELMGKNLYSTLDLAFSTTDTFDSWLADAKAKTLTSSRVWEHVRLKLPSRQEMLQFDMAAYYNKENPANVETIMVLFDHTKRYGEADDENGMLELAVHELRTPITLLRGYIEVLDDELKGKLDPQMASFMQKMQVSAAQLSTFISNILNVARVEANQLVLQLHEDTWDSIVRTTVHDLGLRAMVHNKTIEYTPAANLPTVAVDRVSVYEVLSNLLDNAIKYSPDGQKILVHTSLTNDGLVETTIQDFGAGIPANVLPHLFEKYARNYHNQKQVSGTGLGLYLSKAIVSAHGGNIWVRSKEDEGTTIGFTLQPYSMLAAELKNSDNKDIVRGAYGWIKNHSLYRK